MADLSEKMILYHTGYLEIRQPDIKHGRKNADFGQGFYLMQVVIRSERGAAQLKWLDSHILSHDDIERSKSLKSAEEEAYQQKVAEKLSEFDS